jgi:tetratricopeptide (TPR) repeat protein
MPDSSFWSRLREGRLVRIVVVYLAAAWGVLQFTSLLREELDLPHWVTPSAIVILLVGLAVVLIAAWAHSRLVAPGARAPEWSSDAREIELEEERRRSRPAVLSRSRLATLVVAGTLAVALLLGATRLVVLLRERGSSLGPGEAVAEAAAPGIAVLPFSVRGEGLDVWREGMVDLISTNLDQVAGLRAIDSRTVLARWREQVGNNESPDLETALAVARSTRARYALVGSAVSIGRNVRLAADIYQLEPGAGNSGAGPKSVWQGQVEGAPDSVMALVDELSIRILGGVLERKEKDTPRVNLESITTRSIPALKAYLEGETLLRGSDFTAAVAAFKRAVGSDSTFALAYYRLGTAQGWQEGLGGEGLANMTRAARLASRLPEREAVLVRAGLALSRSTLDGVDSLTEAVARYPDDAEAWYLLGDTYFHLGEMALVDRASADRAFERTIALDPSFAPAYLHLIDDGLVRADSAQLATSISRFERLLPPDAPIRARLRGYRFLDNLVFGDSATREASLAAIDTLPARGLHYLSLLNHPRFLAVQERALEMVSKRPEAEVREDLPIGIFFNRLNQGKLQAAYAMLDDPVVPDDLRGAAPIGFYLTARMGLPIPATRYESALRLQPAGQVPDDFYGPGMRAFYAGALAADEQLWPEVEAGVGRLREYARAFLERGDSTSARFAEGAARALEGYGLWKHGRGTEALPVLQSAQREATPLDRIDLNLTIRFWLGALLLELDRPQDAEPYFRSLSNTSTIVYYRLGQIYERLGRFAEARKAYELFVLAMRDADPELRPMVEDARQAAARLTSVVRE